MKDTNLSPEKDASGKNNNSSKGKKAVRQLADLVRRSILVSVLPQGPEQQYHKKYLHHLVKLITEEHGNLNGLFDYLLIEFPDKANIPPQDLAEILGIDPDFLTGL